MSEAQRLVKEATLRNPNISTPKNCSMRSIEVKKTSLLKTVQIPPTPFVKGECVKRLYLSRHPGGNRGPGFPVKNRTQFLIWLPAFAGTTTGFRLEFIPMKIGAGMTWKRTESIFLQLRGRGRLEILHLSHKEEYMKKSEEEKRSDPDNGAEEIQQEVEDYLDLRPRKLSEYIGQKQVVETLEIAIQAAKKRGEPSTTSCFMRPGTRKNHPCPYHCH